MIPIEKEPLVLVHSAKLAVSVKLECLGRYAFATAHLAPTAHVFGTYRYMELRRPSKDYRFNPHGYSSLCGDEHFIVD